MFCVLVFLHVLFDPAHDSSHEAISFFVPVKVLFSLRHLVCLSFFYIKKQPKREGYSPGCVSGVYVFKRFFPILNMSTAESWEYPEHRQFERFVIDFTFELWNTKKHNRNSVPTLDQVDPNDRKGNCTKRHKKLIQNDI